MSRLGNIIAEFPDCSSRTLELGTGIVCLIPSRDRQGVGQLRLIAAILCKKKSSATIPFCSVLLPRGWYGRLGRQFFSRLYQYL